ncbi:MAG: glycosyltransferase family 2 protein [Desulfuromonadaceae bacterium]|nr:glycosyltransferase family 2 protein [Desulfuromonadaceae bacterium]
MLNSIAELIVYVASALFLYVMIGYPAVLYLFSKLFPKKHIFDVQFMPSVTLIISAHNEEAVIEEKLHNSLALDYPEHLLTTVVVSDASTDRTDEIVLSFDNPRIKLIRPDGHRGKTAGLNVALATITSEIVVFSDANAIYDADAVRNLARHFSDPHIGYVVGNARYQDVADSSAGKSEGAYWDLEIGMKQWESNFSSVVGGDGAIYAIRRELYEPMLESDINDFVNPLQIIAKGYRGIFDQDAWCTEKPAGAFQKEFSRKVRISNRSFNAILRVPSVCNPFKTGWFAWQVVSHKLLRWFLPFILAIQFVADLAMELELLSLFCISAYGIISVLALIGWGQSRKASSPALFYIPYYFALMNLALALGVIHRLQGHVITVWSTARAQSSAVFQSIGLVPVFLLATFITCAFRLCLWFGYGQLFITVSAVLLLYAIVHTYIGYPLWLGVLSHIKSFPIKLDEQYLPRVVLLIAAYNEEREIEAKLLNSLELDYPEDKLSIVVASDGSKDATAEIARRFVGPRVQLFDFSPNRGKISALNESMQQIDADIVILSDANVMYDRQAVRALVRHFNDPRVGAVSGKVVLLNDDLSYGESEGFYYRIEHYIQEKEGQTGCLVGADGAMYAIRRSLFSPPPADTILDDFVISMQIAMQDKMVLHDNAALGFEKNNLEIEGEFKRKVRIIAGGVQCLLRDIGIPYPSQGMLFFKFVSHKLLRWILGPMTVTLIGLLVWIRVTEPNVLFTGALCAILIGIAIGCIGQFIPATRKSPPVSLCHYLLMLNLATFVGWYMGLTGKQRVNWRSTP